ncbi:MAG: lipopolysaccharide biosynthesis protein [Candidatus Bathyarchaeales archaeon]
MPSFREAVSTRMLRRLFKEDVGLVYTTIGGFGSSLLGALFWLFLASILNVGDYGLVNFYIALATVAAAFGALGLNTTVMAYLPKGEENVLYEANSITLVSGLASAIILSIFQWASGFLSAAFIFFNMTLAELLGRKMYRKYALISLGQRIAQIFLSLILYLWFGIVGIILGYFLGSLIVSYRYLKSVAKFTFKINNLKEKQNFTLHSYGFNLVGSLSAYLDKIIIGIVYGYYALGLYQLGYQFFMFLSIIPTSLYQYLLPEESSGKSKKEIQIIGLACSIAVVAIIFILTPYLIEKFFHTFVEATQTVQLMSLAVIPATITATLNAKFLGKGKSQRVFTAGVLGILSLVTGLTIFGRIMGVIGLALALIMAQTIQMIYLVTRYKTKAEEHFQM